MRTTTRAEFPVEVKGGSVLRMQGSRHWQVFAEDGTFVVVVTGESMMQAEDPRLRKAYDLIHEVLVGEPQWQSPDAVLAEPETLTIEPTFQPEEDG